ncbi:MAG: hypothetical protein ABFC30_02435 [Proteiniphilum sp.]|jgi:hypothetical protein
MRFTIRLYLYWVTIFLIFFAGIQVVAYLLWGMHIVLWQSVLIFVIVGMIPPGIITLYFSRRLDYMESNNLNPPSFSGQKMAVFQFKGRTKHPFDEVMQRVDRQWIISFSDRASRTLKFRTDARMVSWGMGGYLKMEDEETVIVIVYPIRPKSKREKLLVNHTLRLMHTILNP